MSAGKNCNICVYDVVCDERKHDPRIIDCCVPEMPLRRAQVEALRVGGVDAFIVTTRVHVLLVKAKSRYWSGKQRAQQQE